MRTFASLGVLVIAVAVIFYLTQRNETTVYEAAPSVTFFSIDGRSIELDGLNGKPVIVSFWATSCVICREKIPQLIELYTELAPTGVELIGVAMPYDPPNRVVEYAKENDIPYTIVTDTDKRITSAFADIYATPTTILIDRKGWIVERSVGEIDVAGLKAKIKRL